MNWQTVQANLPMVKEAQETKIQSTQDVATLCQDIINLAQESFHVLTINCRNYLIDRHLIGLGLVDACLIHPREIFRPAILDGAKAIICVHNHPTGDSTPSAEDIRMTRQLIQASKILEIQIVDHVIMGKPSFNMGKTSFSIRESGLVDFT